MGTEANGGTARPNVPGWPCQDGTDQIGSGEVTMQQREDSVRTADGSFGLTVWLPPGGTGPGLLLIQEIYGVSDYIRAVRQDLAGLGYLVAAPDLFWRLAPGFQAKHDEQGLQESLAMGSRFDLGTGVADTVLALRQLAGMPETGGAAGLIGFCLGGSIAYLAAAEASPAVVVSFYGSAVAGRPDVEIHVEPSAGHAFHNRMAPMFYQPEPAARAWRRAEEFLRKYLPVTR
jgi:carboxymethylenebutenolidase